MFAEDEKQNIYNIDCSEETTNLIVRKFHSAFFMPLSNLFSCLYELSLILWIVSLETDDALLSLSDICADSMYYWKYMNMNMSMSMLTSDLGNGIFC